MVHTIQINRRSRIPLSSITDDNGHHPQDDRYDNDALFEQEWKEVMTTIDNQKLQQKDIHTLPNIGKYIRLRKEGIVSIIGTVKSILLLFDENKPLIVLGPPLENDS